VIESAAATCYAGRVNRRLAVVVCALAVVAGCRSTPVEQRTTHGPSAEELFFLQSYTTNKREPTFDERRYWESQLDWRIAQYLNQHPEDANSLDVSTFKFYRRAAVGQSKEQVMILLGAPLNATSDGGEIEKLAHRYAPVIKGNATEAWVYPVGWTIYFAGTRVIDITQYIEP